MEDTKREGKMRREKGGMGDEKKEGRMAEKRGEGNGV